MVAAALRPAYQRQEVDKNQYTDINRIVSRKMYDRVSDDGGLTNGAMKDKWQSVVAEEVNLAIGRIKKSDDPSIPIAAPA